MLLNSINGYFSEFNTLAPNIALVANGNPAVLFFISISIYSVLSFVALYGYDLNKILGLFLFFSISLLSPNLYPNFEGELFPITYVVFALFLAYILGIEMYKRWKTSL